MANGKVRSVVADGTKEELKRVNAEESLQLAHAFLSPPFLRAQYEFARKKNKTGPARLFWTLLHTRPAWSLLL